MAAQRKPETSSIVARADNIYRTLGDVCVLNGASLEVPAGKLVLLTGSSGSGKSTMVRMFQDIDTPDRGHVELFGDALQDMSPKVRDQILADRVGIGFQAANLDTNLSVWENLIGLTQSRGRKADRTAAAHLLWNLDFRSADMLHRKAGDLSGGQQLKLAFGRIALPQPELLLLDEPTYALDPEGKEHIFGHIADACHESGMAALVVTHDVEPAREVADREYVMSRGRIEEMLTYDR